ncbi:MAG: COX15/CtaA family protein [Proteobacteria bacterium]|nr:COX15/CtaA family protein [Pseudomonadota bacterium]
MVILSAYIRLAEVGIGCPDWPACYAQLNPDMEKKGVTVLTEDSRNVAYYGARIAHRYIASTLGLFIVAIFVVALRQGKRRSTHVLVPIAIFAITVFLSLLGYYTPTRSNPLITMGNLLGGMALLGLLWWLMQRDTSAAGAPADSRGLRPLAKLALCLVMLQIVLGGWSSANYASANCPKLLSCEGALLTTESIADAFSPGRSIEMDSAGQVVRVESLGLLSMAHRLFAIFTAGYLAWLVRKMKAHPELKTALGGTLVALSLFSIGQVALGVSMIWLNLPLFMLSLHNTLAAGLLLSSINLLHRLTPPAASPLPVTPPPHP